MYESYHTYFIFIFTLFLYFTFSSFPAGQQLVTKLVTAPMACGAVMVPTSMFMGQVVTAYNPFGGQQVRTKPGGQENEQDCEHLWSTLASSCSLSTDCGWSMSPHVTVLNNIHFNINQEIGIFDQAFTGCVFVLIIEDEKKLWNLVIAQSTNRTKY